MDSAERRTEEDAPDESGQPATASDDTDLFFPRAGQEGELVPEREAPAAEDRDESEEPALAPDFGADGTITMRDDHTTIGYAIGWGQTTPKEPFIIDIKPADWGKIVELETDWKKQQKYI